MAGPLIGLIVIFLRWYDNKPLAASSSFRDVCAATLPAGIPFLKYNWKKNIWNLVFVGGTVAGGFIAGHVLHHPASVAVSGDAAASMHAMGINDTMGYAPEQVFSFAGLQTLPGFIIIVIGGFLVGFGSRYAGGCVSGHSMSGISDLQWTSVLVTACIFAGGVLTANYLLPLVLNIHK